VRFAGVCNGSLLFAAFSETMSLTMSRAANAFEGFRGEEVSSELDWRDFSEGELLP
jgi:hypothetical protein